jgi:hypothetical protein
MLPAPLPGFFDEALEIAAGTAKDKANFTLRPAVVCPGRSVHPKSADSS